MPSDFESLDPQLKMIVIAAVIAISVAWAVIKFIRPFIDHLSKGMGRVSNDAVVLSASFADGKLIRDLKDSIDGLQEHTEELIKCTRQGNLEQQLQTEAINANNGLMRQMLRAITGADK